MDALNPYDFYPTDDELLAKKREYAAALIRDPWNREKAARSIEPRDTHIAFILTQWQFDGEVNQFMKELQAEAKTAALIPSKEDFAAEVYRAALQCPNRDSKLDYFKLFASVMGYVEKPGTTVNNNNVSNIQSNVLVLPPTQSANDVEARLIEQQRKLINA